MCFMCITDPNSTRKLADNLHDIVDHYVFRGFSHVTRDHMSIMSKKSNQPCDRSWLQRMLYQTCKEHTRRKMARSKHYTAYRRIFVRDASIRRTEIMLDSMMQGVRNTKDTGPIHACIKLCEAMCTTTTTSAISSYVRNAVGADIDWDPSHVLDTWMREGMRGGWKRVVARLMCGESMTRILTTPDDPVNIRVVIDAHASAIADVITHYRKLQTTVHTAMSEACELAYHINDSGNSTRIDYNDVEFSAQHMIQAMVELNRACFKFVHTRAMYQTVLVATNTKKTIPSRVTIPRAPRSTKRDRPDDDDDSRECGSGDQYKRMRVIHKCVKTKGRRISDVSLSNLLDFIQKGVFGAWPTLDTPDGRIATHILTLEHAIEHSDSMPSSFRCTIFSDVWYVLLDLDSDERIPKSTSSKTVHLPLSTHAGFINHGKFITKNRHRHSRSTNPT